MAGRSSVRASASGSQAISSNSPEPAVGSGCRRASTGARKKRASNRRVRPGGVMAQDRQVGQGPGRPVFPPRPGHRGRRGRVPQDKAGLLEGLAHGRHGQGPGPAGVGFAGQQAQGVRGQVARVGGREIRPLDPAAGKHPFGGHKDMTRRAPPHQHFRLPVAAHQDQGRGVLRLLAMTRAGRVGEILGGVERFSRNGHPAGLAR